MKYQLSTSENPSMSQKPMHPTAMITIELTKACFSVKKTYFAVFNRYVLSFMISSMVDSDDVDEEVESLYASLTESELDSIDVDRLFCLPHEGFVGADEGSFSTEPSLITGVLGASEYFLRAPPNSNAAAKSVFSAPPIE